MKLLRSFFKESYTNSPIAFYFEMIEAAFLIAASSILTYTVLDPATEIFMPLYLIGSFMGMIGAAIRKSAWVFVLTLWFTILNATAVARLFL